ncbi:MAG: hypothetical protein ASARMPRED_006296 [Alectoria sarmentosa]|nr:MAG: hypothetical protein ASARMPRED_006296 [Alectoria sarmentosa]
MSPFHSLSSIWKPLTTATFILSTVLTPSLVSANPNCTEFRIPLTATASNEVFPIPVGLNYSNPAAISALVQTVLGDAGTVYPVIPTTFTGIIAGRYCEPEVTIANRSDVVQLFMSGVTENNLYWFGLGYPTGYDGNEYSTVDYASKQGYPTFVIDRIGVGNSTHPDPILQQQVNLEEAVSHELVLMLKAGTAVPGKTFNRVIFVGHSYGSILGNAQATNHPGDISAFILTGYGVSIIPVAADLPQTVPFPADLYAPRFAGLPPGYLVTSSSPGRRAYLWGKPGSYDEGIFEMDYNDEDDVGLGELLSIDAGLKEAPVSTAPVYIITGDSDDVFCLLATCGDGASSPQAQACSLFPEAETCEYFIPVGTGHMISLHYSAQTSFQKYHAFLASVGF